MRKLLLIVLLLASAILCSLPASPQQEPASATSQKTNPEFQKANPEQIHAYIMLIRLRNDLYTKFKETGKWQGDAAANEALSAHSKYWQAQLKSGHAILAGGMNGDYWDNVALIVFEASSLSEAQQMVKDDPAVKAYVFQAQVREFDLQWVSNKFDSSFRKPAAH
jgi:uncharacterized protein YciI